ncbi:uncharacterized protein LOC128265454 [Drosophila gunungcola]|uniref:Uncharacterized protein n=1 Tax=Drosophila gunungcola TaxID=103775 RepID=A0A9P9YAW1_9MUSC|nr:uncharacterized protein LOC128265454 [Drosophila gunungcola]KAI8033551.1 hypothetical protein M5D96_013699 [Drosophila gunungcola]
MLASLNRSTADLYGLLVQFLLKGAPTLVYYNPEGLDCSWNLLWQRNLTTQPQIVWQRSHENSTLNFRFNGDIIMLACLAEGSSGATHLENLAGSLSHLRSVRLLIEVVAFSQDILASQLLSICLRASLLYVELYFQNSNHSPILYTYQAFPKFELVKRTISGAKGIELFANKLSNLQGHRLRVMPDLSPPNTFDYRDASGEQRVAGYLWDFMATFAGRKNASLEVIRPQWQAGGAPESAYMQEYAANGSIDVGLTTAGITKRNFGAIHQYTYPILITSWCTMLPVERHLQTVDLFDRILCPALAVILIVTILVSWLLLRHLSYLKSLRLARIVLRLLALLLMTTCSAQLLSLLISPPYQERITSFDDMLDGDLRILAVRGEFYDFDGSFRARYAGLFHLTDDPEEFYYLRNHFNTTWAYTVPFTKWLVINYQQQHFAKPLFRLAKDLCFLEFIPTSIVVAPYSIYWESLKDFTLAVEQSGLVTHWIRKSFNDLVKAGKMSIKDYSQLVELKSLDIGDLELAWRICGAAVLAAIAIFLMEFIFFYVNAFLNNL